MKLENILKIIRSGKNIFITGPAGCGKTFLLKKIYMMLSSEGYKVGLTATTGVAAVNLSNSSTKVYASTFHRWAGIGTGEDDCDILIQRILQYGSTVSRYLKTHILIIDEISMFGAKLLGKIDFIMRKMREKEDVFGGMKIIFSGDFLQLPPVKDEFVFESPIWKQLDILTIFQDNCKRFDCEDYWNLLKKVRCGLHMQSDFETLRQRCDAYVSLNKNIEEKEKRGVTLKPSLLFSRKADVAQQNSTELEKLKTPRFTFEAKDFLVALQNKPLKNKLSYYQRIVDDSIDQFLTLKVGAQVMLKLNISVADGLINGSRGVITDIAKNSAVSDYEITVQFSNGKIQIIKRMVWTIESKKFKFTRSQYPLMLAWAITIHKIQGCTLDYCVCDLGGAIFCAGQAYVVLSRVRNIGSLYISNLSEKSFMVDKKALTFLEEERAKSIAQKTAKPEFFHYQIDT
ncbi:MAG TPA: DEAD/DEAH box helicase [Nitrosarchaeum sp.]|nr:DEAD/DEAH box helicase [Nitrosarchaeum sp.]